MSDQQVWMPNISPKQNELFNAGISSEAEKNPNIIPAVLASGARFTGKSIGCQHRIVRHLWETPGAHVGMFAQYMKNLTAGGSYADLTQIVIPEWIAGGWGFEYTQEPRQDAKTRSIYFKVRNMFGGESELRLFSLVNPEDAENYMKQLRFSCCYFTELSTFKTPKVLRAAIWQLRMMHLRPYQHLFLADTNPSDEGEKSWIYKYWYLRRLEKDDAKASGLLNSLKLIEFFLEDNPWLTPEQREYYEGLYLDDKFGKERDLDGKWVAGHGVREKHFADLFSVEKHVIGGTEAEGDQIDVDPATEVLYVGWDVGSSVNHAAVITEKRIVNVNGRDLSVYCLLDEVVSTNERLQVGEFTQLVMAKMKAIEDRAGKKFIWRHWSDDTALNVFRATGAAGTDAAEVQIASGNQIILQGVPKPEGSVKSRVTMCRRLLRESRLWVSSRCEKMTAMFEELRTGSKASEYIVWNEHKHPFDAFSYVVLMESAGELLTEVYKPTAASKLPEAVSIAQSPLL